MRYIDFFNKQIDIYLASHLGEHKGEYLARNLYEKGFINLFLTTGFEIEKFPLFPWIKKIIGKEPIFNDTQNE